MRFFENLIVFRPVLVTSSYWYQAYGDFERPIFLSLSTFALILLSTGKQHTYAGSKNEQIRTLTHAYVIRLYAYNNFRVTFLLISTTNYAIFLITPACETHLAIMRNKYVALPLVELLKSNKRMFFFVFFFRYNQLQRPQSSSKGCTTTPIAVAEGQNFINFCNLNFNLQLHPDPIA